MLAAVVLAQRAFQFRRSARRFDGHVEDQAIGAELRVPGDAIRVRRHEHHRAPLPRQVLRGQLRDRRRLPDARRTYERDCPNLGRDPRPVDYAHVPIQSAP